MTIRRQTLAETPLVSIYRADHPRKRLAAREPLGIRLAAARRILLDGVAVTDACYDSGFRGLSHFIHFFKRRFGYKPSAACQRLSCKRCSGDIALPAWSD